MAACLQGQHRPSGQVGVTWRFDAPDSTTMLTPRRSSSLAASTQLRCLHDDFDAALVEDLRVVCLPCLLDRMAQPGHRYFDLGIHTRSSCGDDELVAFISAVVHVEGWDSVEHLLTAPLGFACPACDGFEGKLPPIVIKRWAA